MNKAIFLNLFLIFFLSSCFWNKKSNSILYEKKTKIVQKKIESYYTCSMHSQIKKHKPGKCPICHMRLTKIEKEVHDKKHLKTKKYKASDVIGKIKLKNSQIKHLRAEVFSVTNMLMSKKIHLLGSIIQSEETESKITARISGRVEKIYIKSTGSLIKKNSPILQLYSPRLITAGEEYLIARNNYQKTKNKIFKNILKQSTQRLKLWGIKNFQYNKWFKQKKVPKKITIYSPASGIVRKRNAVVGKYFKEGQNFFELSDLSNVWVEMDIYEQDSSLVEIGQKVELEFTALPGEIVQGEIDFINPILNSVSRTLKIRSTIKNSSGKLKPGMIANATLNIVKKEEVLVVPKTAIIDTGKRKIVWIQISNKTYQAKIINTGYQSGGFVEVKKGLKLLDKVVTDGNFLLDAQAQLFDGYKNLK